ncbi:MAG: AbrB/MazE/SpoVT family DNA-binding domain-containing protein [Defluviitaleaceae bacterium]|nr:AbrB/MazE/SpoVT family DNA-binding domain-containing protein [Defluviitaleaceae bacterium]
MLAQASQVSKWGNSQGIRIPKKLLQSAGLSLNDEVEISAQNNVLVIRPATKKTLSWYLEGYDNEIDRYDWSDTDEPKGRELLCAQIN